MGLGVTWAKRHKNITGGKLQKKTIDTGREIQEEVARKRARRKKAIGRDKYRVFLLFFTFLNCNMDLMSLYLCLVLSSVMLN